MGSPQPTRQKALSDSHIQLPRNLAFMDLGLDIDGEDPPPPNGFRRLRTIPSSLELEAIVAPTPVEPPKQITVTIHRAALHFTFHLLLISLFETLFFWLFVSQQEDSALSGLVNDYTGKAFQICSNLTVSQKADLRSWFGLLFNATLLLDNAATASTDRRAFNSALLRNSWLYFGGLATTFGLLTSTALLRHMTVRWGHLVGENLTLVALLGLYEWMFFRTVALQYRAITPAELDGMVVTEFQTAC
jgi:hypothetical protein